MLRQLRQQLSPTSKWPNGKSCHHQSNCFQSSGLESPPRNEMKKILRFLRLSSRDFERNGAIKPRPKWKDWLEHFISITLVVLVDFCENRDNHLSDRRVRKYGIGRRELWIQLIQGSVKDLLYSVHYILVPSTLCSDHSKTPCPSDK